MKPTRLLHVHSGNLFGGVESMLLALKKAEPPELDQSFALCWQARFAEELTALGAHVLPLPEVRLRNPILVARAQASLRNLLASVKPDVVLFHSAWSQLIFAAPVARAKIPFARYVHGIPSRSEWMDRLAMRWRPALIISAGNFTGDIAARVYRGLPQTVVRYPVDIDSFKRSEVARERVRASLGVREDTVVILQASRMESWKGQALHLEALHRLKTTRPWQAWFAGGAQRPEEMAFAESLARQASQLNLSSRVRFLGQRSDIPALLSAADIFCQPNEGPEPFGIIFVEALAAGVPVVTTNIGGGAEIVEGYGQVVTPDPLALAAVIDKTVEAIATPFVWRTRGPQRARALCDPATQATILTRALGGLAASNG